MARFDESQAIDHLAEAGVPEFDLVAGIANAIAASHVRATTAATEPWIEAFIGLFLVADLATRMRRVGQRKGDASDATPEIATLQEGYDVGTVDWTRIDVSGTPEQTLENGKAELVRRRQPDSG